MDKTKILLIDEDESMAEAICRIFIRNGFEIINCLSLKNAKNITKEFLPQIVIIGTDVAKNEFISFFNDVKNIVIKPKILIISGIDNEVELLQAGADEWLKKPYTLPVLLTRINVLCRE